MSIRPRPALLAAWLRTRLHQRRAQIVLTLRITVSALLSLALALALGMPLPLWVVMTALILTQASVGRSLRAAIDYMIGTLGGAIYGGAIAVLIPHESEIALLAVLALAVAPLALIAALNPRMNVAPITAVIVLLLPAITHHSPLDSAINRVLEVALGAFTGLVVSLIVFPSSAHRQAIEAAARTLNLMASAFSQLIADITHGRDVDTLHEIQDGIGKALVRLDAVAAEAGHERSARLASEPETGPLLRTLLRLRHDLVIMGRAVALPLPDILASRLKAPLSQVSKAYTTYMRGCARALSARENPPSLDEVRLALEIYAVEISKVRSEGLTRALSAETIEHFFALGFALDEIHQNFGDLERCVTEWGQGPAPAKAPAAVKN
ncbi:MAG: FUSC family protein [Pseudomonadota bacterium]